MKVKITHLINLNNTIYDKLETSLSKGLLTWQTGTQILNTSDGMATSQGLIIPKSLPTIRTLNNL